MVPFKIWLWSLCDALYGFLGWDEEDHIFNLAGSCFPISISFFSFHSFTFGITLVFGLMFFFQVMVDYTKHVASLLLLSPMNEISMNDFIEENR